MKLIIKKFLLLLSVFSLLSAKSQVKNIGLPDIKNYKRTVYNAGTQNWNIDQDKNGIIYFANNEGLVQFNGTSWKNYQLPNKSVIRSLKVDKLGVIYVGGNNEFGYFKPNSKGKLVYQSLSSKLNTEDKKDINLIWRVHLYNETIIFQSFTKIFIFENNKCTTINALTKFQFSFVLNNKLYVQDKTEGILELRAGKLYPIAGTKYFNGTEIWSMLQVSQERFLIMTLEKGLFIYEDGKVTPWNTEANNFVLKNTSLGGIIIDKKFIVLNTVLNGIAICDLNGKITQHLNHNKGIQNNTILTSFIDDKKNLWLGLDNGISFININSPFTFFDYSYNLSTVYSSVVFENNLYIATNQGLFYHPWDKDFKDEPFKLVPGTNAQAWNIQVFDTILLCASNRGALVINNKTATKLDPNGYFGFRAIPNKPSYILGLSYTGFSIFKKKNGKLILVNHVKGFNEIINSFEIELDNDFIWLHMEQYIYQIKLTADLLEIETITKHHKISNTIPGIKSLQKINNKVYFQSQNQFYRYSKEQEIFFKDKQMTALFKKVPLISSIKEDSHGNLWYTYNESLGVLKKNYANKYTNSVAPFANLKGSLVKNFVSINTVDSKNIFIGLIDGLAHYDSEISSKYISKPRVFITNFSYPGESINTNYTNNQTTEYTIPYRSNHVKFSFSSPTYENQENVKYSYKLVPFETEWHPWTTLSIKEYTNLKEGDYTMEIKAKNGYGIASNVASLEFEISPPWYRHYFAYIFYVVLLISLFIITSNQIKLKIRKNKYYETIEQRRLYLEKEAKIKHEQHELEKEIEKLKNDKLQIQILSKDKELVNNSLQVAKKNKVLNGIIHKLKEIDNNQLDEATKFQVTKLNKSIVKEVNNDKSWKDLEKHIKNVHFEFLKRLKEKHPTISPRELDLSTYLLMNMSTKEIVEIMNISSGGVELARYRLRKKLELNKKENLTGYLMSI